MSSQVKRYKRLAFWTPVPPSRPAPWYGVTKPCKHCKGVSTRWRAIEGEQQMLVMHEASCVVVE